MCAKVCVKREVRCVNARGAALRVERAPGRVWMLMAICLVAGAIARPARAQGADASRAAESFDGRLDRRLTERAVLERHPALLAEASRATALERRARAEGALPPPELMAELWQVPLKRPYAVDDAGMLMLSLRQNVPAPGARAARAEALRHEARARAWRRRKARGATSGAKPA